MLIGTVLDVRVYCSYNRRIATRGLEALLRQLEFFFTPRKSGMSSPNHKPQAGGHGPQPARSIRAGTGQVGRSVGRPAGRLGLFVCLFVWFTDCGS